MLGENKTLKDSKVSKELTLRDTSSSLSYTKANKLIAGLYMVTDIMDKEDPIRLKLRTIGVIILSDINSLSLSPINKNIEEIVSFLDIARVVGIISTMNAGILKKEFLLLQKSVKEALDDRGMPSVYGADLNLSEFLTDTEPDPRSSKSFSYTPAFKSIGHVKSTRIGVQKGHSLMQALSDRISDLSDKKDTFDVFKKDRREQIKRIIINHPTGATIKDIRTEATGTLASCSEKTLQRELLSMVKDDVLNKTGEKRWSRYFLNLM